MRYRHALSTLLLFSHRPAMYPRRVCTRAQALALLPKLPVVLQLVRFPLLHGSMRLAHCHNAAVEASVCFHVVHTI